MTTTDVRTPSPATDTRWPLGTWVTACVLAETTGMTAAAAAAQLADRLPGAWDHRAAFALSLIVLGGLVEGTALGVLQGRVLSSALPLHGRRVARRWAVVTVLVAGVGWAAASAPAALSDTGSDGTQPPMVLVLAGAAALGAVMGMALGGAQAWALSIAVSRPRRWVWISALAWTPAMAVIFAGATLAAGSWPTVVLTGTATGVVAGSVLGLVSGSLLHLLLDTDTSTSRRRTS